MGRNADKRRARKMGSAPGADDSDEEGAAAPVGEARSFLAGLEIPSGVVLDGSLAKALFKVTCLLSVRDARGVSAENLARTASEVAAIVEADTVSLMRLEHGDDVVPPMRIAAVLLPPE